MGTKSELMILHVYKLSVAELKELCHKDPNTFLSANIPAYVILTPNEVKAAGIGIYQTEDYFQFLSGSSHDLTKQFVVFNLDYATPYLQNMIDNLSFQELFSDGELAQVVANSHSMIVGIQDYYKYIPRPMLIKVTIGWDGDYEDFEDWVESVSELDLDSVRVA